MELIEFLHSIHQSVNCVNKLVIPESYVFFGSIGNEHDLLGHRESGHHTEVDSLVRQDCQLIVEQHSLFVRDYRSFLGCVLLARCRAFSKYGDCVGVTSYDHNGYLVKVTVRGEP